MAGSEEIIEVFTKINDASEMKKLVKEILTPKEIKDLSLRWELMKMLTKKISQRKIAKTLRISLCKITRGAKILKDRNSVAKRLLTENKDKL
jgi:TrpR family transcriptional regulator, trp operon repressor